MSHKVASIAAETLANGGATFGPDGTPIRTGYSVAGIATALRIPVEDFTPETLSAALALFEGEEAYGTWIWEGEVWIEPTTVLRQRWKALGLAVLRREIAFYDLNRGRTIRLRRG